MESNIDSIKICDESVDGEDRFQLYIDGCRRGLVTKKGGIVQMHWQVSGPITWQESKVWVQGILELTVIADQLNGEPNVKRKSRSSYRRTS